MTDADQHRSRSASRELPLRVAMISPYSLSIPGGVQQQVLGLSRELRRIGVEVRVLGPCDGPPPEPYVTPLGDSLPTAANGSIAPLAPDPSAALRTMWALRDEDFDIIHVHEPAAPGPTITAVTLHPAPVVGTFHAAGRSTSYRILGSALGRIMRRVDRKIAVSKDAMALAQGFLGGDYEIFFNGVDTFEIQAAEPRTSAVPAIFFLGRHEERKGLDVLLAALAEIDRPLVCWIGGDGPDTARLRSRCNDPRIEWLGRLSETDKLARLRGASVFAAPSLHGESFGIVLAEAMAAGTPVVASALDGYQNVATDGVDALLVPPGDATALAAAIERVLDSPELADRLQTAGLRRADELSMSNLARKYLAIYNDLCSASVTSTGPTIAAL